MGRYGFPGGEAAGNVADVGETLGREDAGGDAGEFAGLRKAGSNEG